MTLLRVDVLERLAEKYAESPRFEYGFNYHKPSGESVRFPSLSARQPDPSSWETNYATRKPGEAFRVGHTREKAVELPPLNAAAVEADPKVTRRLTGDFGGSRVHPGFVTPGLAGQSGRKAWDGQQWRTEAPAASMPDFRRSDGLVMPRFDGPKPVGQLTPQRVKPLPTAGLGLFVDDAEVLNEAIRQALMTQRR